MIPTIMLYVGLGAAVLALIAETFDQEDAARYSSYFSQAVLWIYFLSKGV